MKTLLVVLSVVALAGCGESADDLPTDFENGTWLVGEDVASGTYRTDGAAEDGEPCMIFTSKEPDDADTLVDAHGAIGPTEFRVTTGLYVNSSGCQRWVKADVQGGD